VADPDSVGTWLAPTVSSWVASAGPLVAQGAVTLLEWPSTAGIPLIPIISEGFRIAPQLAQKDEVVSSAPIVAANDFMETLAGYINVSRQLLDFSDRNADLLFGIFDVSAEASFDKRLADLLVANASTGHADIGAAFDSFPADGMYSPSVLAAPPSYVLSQGNAIAALTAGGIRIVVDHRLAKPVVLDPAAAIFVASNLAREQVEEPSVLGVSVGMHRYLGHGVSPAGVAAIG
jgi:hypothetical protein